MPAQNRWQGFDARAQGGREVTKGTAVTPTVFAQPVNFTAEKKEAQETLPSLRRVGGVKTKRRYTIARSGAFKLSGQLTYDNMGLLLEDALGSGSTAGGGPPYVHTYTSGTTDTTLLSTTWEAFPTGDLAECVQLEGAVCSKLTITIPNSGFVTFDAEYISMTATDFASGTAETLPTNINACLGAQTTVTIGGTDHSDVIENCVITIDNNLEAVKSIGSYSARDVRHQHDRMFTIEFDIQCDDTYVRALIDDRIARTLRAVVVTISDGTYSHVFTAANAEIMEDINPANTGVGQVKAKVRYECLAADTPTAALTCVTTNLTSSKIGNG